jgi:hypothetical protein
MLWTSPVWVDGTREGPEEALPAWNEEPSVDLEKVGENAATAHLEGLLGYLRREERVEAFEQLTPLEVVHAPMGDYAVFLCRLNGRRTRIHWFYGFEMPRIRLEPGWVPYGPERVMYQSWAAPLFDRQMPL